jgi:hypothetical protein
LTDKSETDSRKTPWDFMGAEERRLLGDVRGIEVFWARNKQ